MRLSKEFKGETLGTFLLVVFGCGSVAVTVLFNAHQGLMQIALAWGLGVTLAIYLTRHLSCAHLNPAVTIAMVISKRMSARKLPVYLSAQFLGAFLAGVAVYLLFAPSITAYESAHSIIRGSAGSVQIAKMFGEYYSQPGSTAVVSMPLAIGAEAFGTFLLVLMIFALTEGCNVGRPSDVLAPLFIGLTVSSVICLVAPLTQAGLNPARDFGPRMVAWITGWDSAAFPDQTGGFFLVYILGPIVGGIVASLFFLYAFEPAMKSSSVQCDCDTDNSNFNEKKQ
jgi:glycerol uptake facilitator protein